MAYQKQNYFQRRTKPRGPRTNERIRASQVQVISDSNAELNFLDLIEFFYKKNIPTRVFEIYDLDPVLSFNTLKEAESISNKH